MPYKTGKTVSFVLTAHIDFSANISGQYYDGTVIYVPNGGGPDGLSPSDPLYDVLASSASVGFDANVYVASVLAQMSGSLGVKNNTGSSTATFQCNIVLDGHSFSINQDSGVKLEGLITVSTTADEVFDLSDPMFGDWINAVPDSPAPSQINYYLVGREGATRTSTFAMGGQVFTVTAVQHAVVLGPTGSVSANLSGTGGDMQGWSSVTSKSLPDVAGAFNVRFSVPFSIPAVTVTSTANIYDVTPYYNLRFTSSASVTESEIRLAVSDQGGICSGTLTGEQSVPVSLSGVVRAMNAPYPGSASVTVVGIPDGSRNLSQTVSVSGGSFSVSGTQKQYGVSATVLSGIHNLLPDGTSTSAEQSMGFTESTRSRIYARLGGLDANGDEPALTRLLMRGSLLPGVTISQADSFNLFGSGGVSCAWSAGAVTVGGVATLAPGSCSLVFTPRVSALSYRYLRISVRSVGAANVALSVSVPPNSPGIDPIEISGGGSVGYEDVYSGAEEATKIWDIVTGADGSWVDADLDLCLPRNMASIGSVDGQDTRFPLPMRMPKFYGVSRITSLDIAGVPSAASGQTVQVRLVYFVRKGGAGASITDYLPTFYPNRGRTNVKFRLDTDWDAASAKYRPTETLDTGTTIEYYQRRMFSGRCDGKATIDESDFGYTKTTTTDDVTYSFSGPSISGFAAAVNASDAISVPASGHITRYPGITATVTAPTASATGYAHDDYFNRNLPATFLCGAGAWFDPTSGWNFGLDMAQGAVPAQPLYDSISVYGGCGDVFGHAGGGDTLVLKAAAILRGGGHALVWGATGSALAVPVGGRGVRVSEGSPATDGGHGVTGAADGYARTTDPWLHAKSVQVLVTPAGGGPAEWTFTAPFGTMYGQRASGESSVGIVPWSRRRVRGAFVVDLGGGHWISMDVSPTGRLAQATTNTAGLIVFRLAMGFLVGTFSDIVTSISGNHPCCVFARVRAGGELILVYESGGAILRRATPDEGGSFTMAITVSSAGAFPSLCVTPTGAEAFAWVTSGGAVMVRVLSAFGTQMLAPTVAVASGAAQDAVAILCRADGGLVLAYNGAGGIITVSSSDGGKTWA